MNFPFLFYAPPWVFAIGIFIAMISFNWLGYRFRKMQMRKYPDTVESIGAMEGSLLGLMALILAFSFGMASTKFENRRVIIIEEANDIGTAIHMSYLYSDSVRDLFLHEFANYVEVRNDYYEAKNDAAIKTALGQASTYSTKLLKLAIKESKDPTSIVRSAQMIPALNDMIDIVTTREGSRTAKTPPLVLGVLVLLVLSAAFLLGYGDRSTRKNTVIIAGFAAMTALTIYLIMELDRPRMGLVNLDEAARNITDLRKELNENILAMP